MNQKRLKTAGIIAASVVGALLVAVASYLLYVVCTYYRVEPDLSLPVAGEAEETVPVGEELTLLTYNIGFGAYSADYSFFMDGGEHSRGLSEEAVKTNIAGALATVQKADPDFVALQEVDVKGTRSYSIDQTALFAAGLPGYDRVFGQNYDSPYFLYPFHSPIGANRSGIMTFSRYDLTASTRVQLPIEDTLYKFLDLDRAYTRSTVPTANGKALIFYNVHLSAYTSDGTIADEQLALLAADMQTESDKGNYVLAAGDFNKDLLGDSSLYFEREEGDFTWAQPLKTEMLPQGMTVYSGKNAPTCRNADAPYRGDGTDFVLSVDGVIAGAGIEVVACDTVDVGFAYSDHNPVVFTFRLTEE